MLQQDRLLIVRIKEKKLKTRFLRKMIPILNKTRPLKMAASLFQFPPIMLILPITPESFKTCSMVVLARPSKQLRESTEQLKGLLEQRTLLRRPASPPTTQTATKAAAEMSPLSHPTAAS